MRLAHLTDIHLPIPGKPALGDLLNKRALGYLNWRRKRRFRHDRAALDAIVADLKRQTPDFTAISGDLINVSLLSEFLQGRQWFTDNFEDHAAAFCPGNHDAYVKTPWEIGLGRWRAFMVGARLDDPALRAPRDAEDFPFVRTLGNVSLVFVNSSPPTAPGLASGRLGRRQLQRLGLELLRLKAAGQCRILVLHHPITKGATSRRKALDDDAALRTLLATTGVELVLHGHLHSPLWTNLETSEGPRPVVGGASASHPEAHGRYPAARYNIYSIAGDANGWRIEAEVRELDPVAGDVKSVETRRLLPVAP